MNGTQRAILAIIVAATISIPVWLPMAMPEGEKISPNDQSRVELADSERVSENSRIIAELHRSVDILDKSVNDALERAKYLARTVRFVPVVVTAYNPVVTQTDSTPQITASNKQASLGRPSVQPFGNIKKTPKGPVLEEVREPLVDVFDEEDHLLIVAELPGIEKNDVHTEIKGDILILETEKGERKYSKEVLLPSAVDVNSLESSFKNGILEIKLMKAGK